MDPSHQLSGYSARYMDVIGPVGGDRAPGMVALFERCVLPTLCDEARTAVKHGFPYFRMNHFSQVGQDMLALRHYGTSYQGTFVDVGASDGVIGSNT